MNECMNIQQLRGLPLNRTGNDFSDLSSDPPTLQVAPLKREQGLRGARRGGEPLTGSWETPRREEGSKGLWGRARYEAVPGCPDPGSPRPEIPGESAAGQLIAALSCTGPPCPSRSLGGQPQSGYSTLSVLRALRQLQAPLQECKACHTGQCPIASHS